MQDPACTPWGKKEIVDIVRAGNLRFWSCVIILIDMQMAV